MAQEFARSDPSSDVSHAYGRIQNLSREIQNWFDLA